MSRVPVILSLLYLCISGCGTESTMPVTVTDSAGIQITLTDPGQRIFGSVGTDPVLSLGGPDALGPTQFHQIQGVHIDSKDRIWVADGQSAELRLFLPDGRHLRTVGGRGNGPGEFQRLRLLGPFRGDSVAVWDLGLSRLTVLDGEGDLARSEQVVPGDRPSIRCSGVFEDGSLLGQVPTILAAGSLDPGQLLGDSTHLVRLRPGVADPQVWADGPGPEWIWTGRNQVPMPFTANAAFSLRGEELHFVAGSEFRIRVFLAGEVVRIYGLRQAPMGVTEGDVELYREFVEEYIPESSREEFLNPLLSPDLPGFRPAFSDVVVASDGRLWARAYSSDIQGPGTWHVFDLEGVWLGTVGTPPGFSVQFVGDDMIVGVWRDELGVEHVRVYPFHTSQEAT